MNLFYQPDNGYLADVIPFYEAGYYYLFYLHDYRNRSKNGEGTPWFLVRTKDFVHFEEFGEVLPRGDKESQDLYVFTGSVFKKGEHDYYLFYTGHNPHYTTKPQQAIMSARSTDLIHWQKDPDATFFAPIDQFESDDWRDPFVFYDHHQDTYKMLLASRLKDGGRRRRGATVMMRSDDLLNWHVERLLYAPEMYYTHECPDYFSIGKYWYLIYSEFSHHRVTHYRISEHPDGPWLMPSDGGILDSPAYYAAKTAGNGSKRFLFGWNPTKRDNRDEGLWEWGGNLVVHELKQRPDGSLAQVMPEGYRDQFTKLLYVHDAFIGKQGKATFSPIHIPYPETYLLQTSIVFDRDVSHAGIALRFDAETDDSYWYIIEPRSNRLVFDRFPNDAWHFMNFHGLEKYTPLIPGSTVQIEIIVDGDIAVCYLNQKAVLSTRMHLNPGKPLALVSINGRTRFEELKIFTLGGRS